MKRLIIISLALVSLLLSQAAAPFVTVVATVPPAIGQPGVTLAWDTTNKLLVVTFIVSNATGVTSTLFTTSYNPRTIEGVSAGALTLSVGGVTTLLRHNLPTDPLTYSIGNTTTVLSSCTTACPAIPW
jgi:hypothetical protein